MANRKHLDLLKQGVEIWNQWRKKHPSIEPDLSTAKRPTPWERAHERGRTLAWERSIKVNLSGADLQRINFFRANLLRSNLSGADLSEANLVGANLAFAYLGEANLYRTNLSGANLSRTRLGRANLRKANLHEANLHEADLHEADLYEADLHEADLYGTDLRGANLRGADLRGIDLRGADFRGADLQEANLSYARIIRTNLTRAKLNGCRVYGISVWDAKLEDTEQLNLVIKPELAPFESEVNVGPTITVDNIEVAQFIYLLLNNQRIRQIIDTITSKVVLILGRFTPERKVILDALRDAFRKHNYSPILFDFEIPESRDITETVSLLARMARFVIADLTDAKSIPQELSMIIPDLPSVPIQPLSHVSDREYSMFEHFRRYPWVLKDYHYISVDDLLSALKEHIIDPVEQKVQELRRPQ